jgi:hypothetical protein
MVYRTNAFVTPKWILKVKVVNNNNNMVIYGAKVCVFGEQSL